MLESHQEFIDSAVKNLADAIAKGNFREAVASLIGAVNTIGFREGEEYAIKMVKSPHCEEYLERKTNELSELH